MALINKSINNIIELTSWLSEKEIGKLPSGDRKIAKLAVETKNSSQVPKALRDIKKLSMVEKHLEQMHHSNPILRCLGIAQVRTYSKEEILKKKSSTLCARISRFIKNLFGRISSKKLFYKYYEHDPSQIKTRAARGSLYDLCLLAEREQDREKRFRILKAADKNNDHSGNLHRVLAQCYLNPDKSLKYYRKAVALGNQDAALYLGKYYEEKGEDKMARLHYRIAYEMALKRK